MAMARAKGLGRGLDALLGDNDTPVPVVGENLRMLDIDELQPGKYQPRTRMSEEALAELAGSIKAQGVMQPILVRSAGGRFEIVAGERRWRAARMAGLTTVPVLVKEIADQQALAAALIENIQREDLNPLEEAVGIERLIKEFGLTHQAIAETLGRSRTAVTNLLRLLELAPPVRALLSEGGIDMGHARALLALPVAGQLELAQEAARKRLSVREVEARVAAALKGTQPRRTRADRDVVRLEEEWSDRLGTTVHIKPGGKRGGKLIIAYRTLDELDQLLSKLGGA